MASFAYTAYTYLWEQLVLECAATCCFDEIVIVIRQTCEPRA